MKISEFKLLTDENIDAQLVAFLKDKGFDVFDIQEQRLFNLSDKSILAKSVEQDRVIIS
ncbi:MAG: DUF5615 family PIN-like protein [Bacteroidota bacterium]